MTSRIFLALFLFCLAATTAPAQIDMERAMEASSAMSRLLAAIDSGSEDGNYPRFADPSAAYLFESAFDTEILGVDRPVNGDLSTLAALQRKAGEVARGYVAAGTRSDPADTLDRAARNFLEFLPEIAIAYDYSLVTGALIARITTDMSHEFSAAGGNAPAVSESFGAIARAQAQLLELVIGCSSDPNIRQSWRLDRMVLLNRTAPQFAALLPTELAQSIADRALAAAISEQDDQVATELKQFALAILR